MAQDASVDLLAAAADCAVDSVLVYAGGAPAVRIAPSLHPDVVLAFRAGLAAGAMIEEAAGMMDRGEATVVDRESAVALIAKIGSVLSRLSSDVGDGADALVFEAVVRSLE